MKLKVVFDCVKCKLQTPAVVQIPDDCGPDQPLELSGKCFHCGGAVALYCMCGELLETAADKTVSSSLGR